MKTNALVKLVVWVLLSSGLSACGGVIPSPYRGSYVDSSTGTQLELQKEAGILSFTDGRVLHSSAEEMTFEQLKTLKTGIYVVREPKGQANLMDVYWISPKLETRSEAAGLLWLDAEVVFTTMRSDVEQEVQQLALMHCTQGRIMLDIPKTRWQAGCPAGATYFNMKRVTP